ncbi:MAG: OmpW family protein [Rhodospirillaceae bacterium]|jgi:outer membrane protein|nr:OmpW family protein [Rhodospirillaceae bacterium]MBT4690258.1 OmpW family protein [Rhodospirillaceae bacterium]MBT5079823.1 OmpW family protein [Rhodospirillaceae bacterium]MBT5523279.1 OmpW family protein [Rhodospirillaceae bacterium]MBT5879407.1 OmpW family protein [Rhodospirillaceae bacterium]
MQIKAVWFFNRYSAANLHTLGRSLVFDFSRTCAFALAFVLGTVTVMPIAVAKDAGDFVVRLRGIAVQTDTDGSTDVLGGRAYTSDDHVPELDFTYFFTPNIAAELILATTKHSVQVRDSTAGDLALGTVRLIPPVLTLQYHFMPKNDWSPYLGIGVNYTFADRESTGSSVTSVKYSDELGYALQAGIDYRLNDKWSLNADVKKVFVHTDIRVNGGTIRADDTDLDPLILGIGVGYKF